VTGGNVSGGIVPGADVAGGIVAGGIVSGGIVSGGGVAGAPSVPMLAAMKRGGRKIVSVVAWDYQIARVVDRVGVDIVSVGDTVGVNLWGHANPFEITMDEMVMVAQSVRRGVSRALLSCDFPYGPLQEGSAAAVRAAIRLVKEAGVDMVKLDGAADFPDAVTAVDRAGIPVWAQMGITPQRALRYGLDYAAMSRPGVALPAEMTDELVAEAQRLEQAGASLLDFTNSGPVAGPAVAAAVSIPVLGGFGGGPWLDGRVRMAHAAIGYAASGLDTPPDTYANVAQIAFDALSAYANDVRAGHQIKGGIPVPVPPPAATA
jgi:3-methyl-2-oxobutanoate hydroxymethyltransferase